MVEKCANCRYIDQLRENEDEGKCKGCNDENNSVNWEYDKSYHGDDAE